jgi:uncharacterized protein YcaQ
VRHLTLLQIDPVAAIAPSADLVAWSRPGSAYSLAELDAALENRTLVELRALIRPSEDLALFRADMASWDSGERANPPGWRSSNHAWVHANDACRQDILYGDALVGKLDATADRAAGVLRVNAIHQDVSFTKAATAAIGDEVEDLVRWLKLDLAPPG